MKRPLLLVVSLLGTAAPALAVPDGQYTLADGHSYVSACSGSTLGTFVSTGSKIGDTGFYRTCGEATSAGVGASSHASFSTTTTGPIPSGSGALTNTATGSASVGAIHLLAENSASTATYFAGAQVNGGWNDQVTIGSNPALFGTAGIWVFSVHVDGTLAADGHYGASSGFGVEILKNHDLIFGLGANVPVYNAFVAANPVLVPNFNVQYGAYEQKNWSYGWGDHDQDVLTTISEDVFFAVPFVYGTPFTLGVFAQASAGESSYSVYFGDDHSKADFAHTISWGDKGYLLASDGTGPHATNFTVSSLSGFAYAGGVPEPASWALMLAGFGLSGGALRSRRRAVPAG